MGTSSGAPARDPLVRRLRSGRWWVTDRQGRVVVGQLPNPALGVWLVATLLTASGRLDGSAHRWVEGAGAGALLVWALDELLRGASPFRRVLGAVVLVLVATSAVGELR